MKQFDTLQRAILGVGLLVSLVWFFLTVRNALGSLDVGSGGLGAISAGITESLAEFLVPVVVNLALVPWARRRGRTAVKLRWAHLLTTLGLLVLILWSFGTMMSSPAPSGWTALTFFVISALLVPAQVLFAAAFLALAVRRARPGQ